MRTVGIWQTNITDLVAEGTMVKEGDYVATLDKTELTNRMRDAQTQMDKMLTQLEQAKIDTAIELRGIRDQIVNLQFQKKEKQLQLEQSRFEPQSVIHQAELDLERAERDYQQLVERLAPPKRNLRQKSPNKRFGAPSARSIRPNGGTGRSVYGHGAQKWNGHLCP
ncbi:MAG: hypothetical protein IPK21_23540 [Haliscomenobacter sp.]|nr:hypothetical protein [Haliscomenobacter sp.]